jgi:hypothetical protein
MTEPRIPVLIRIRAGLKARVEELAKCEHRSMNQQIEFLLERALEKIVQDTNRLPVPSEKRKQKREGS